MQHLIVIDHRARPFFALLIEPGDLVTAFHLLGLERGHGLFRVRHALVVGEKRLKIRVGRDGFAGHALVIFGSGGLFLIRHSLPVKRVGSDVRLVEVEVGGGFVSLHRRFVVLLLLASRTDFQLRVRRDATVRSIGNDGAEQVRRFIHRRVKRNGAP